MAYKYYPHYGTEDVERSEKMILDNAEALLEEDEWRRLEHAIDEARAMLRVYFERRSQKAIEMVEEHERKRKIPI